MRVMYAISSCYGSVLYLCRTKMHEIYQKRHGEVCKCLELDPAKGEEVSS